MAERISAELDSFIDAVKEMRKLQKEYFVTRDSNVLTNAKKAERVVDRLLDKMEQPKLF